MRTDEGFLLVATNHKPYHTAAQQLADSLKEFAPEHPVILFTEDKWVDCPGNHIFDEVRGGDSTSFGSARYNKDFAIAYDRYICLKAGNYKVTFRFLQRQTGGAIYLKLSGNNVAAMHQQDAGYGSVSLQENLQLKRGDYLQIYDNFHGGLWSHFYIERI